MVAYSTDSYAPVETADVARQVQLDSGGGVGGAGFKGNTRGCTPCKLWGVVVVTMLLAIGAFAGLIYWALQVEIIEGDGDYSRVVTLEDVTTTEAAAAVEEPVVAK